MLVLRDLLRTGCSGQSRSPEGVDITDVRVPGEAAGEGSVRELVAPLERSARRVKPAELERLVQSVVAHRELWWGTVRPTPLRRAYRRLYRSDVVEVWVIGWERDQQTEWHDHGGSSGAFWVAAGELVEGYRLPSGRLRQRTHAAGSGVAFGPTYAHNVWRAEAGPAFSIHAYSPPLDVMTYYRVGRFGLVATDTVACDGPEGGRSSPVVETGGVESLLERTRAFLERLEPAEAWMESQRDGAVLIDIRPVAQRQAEGVVPGARAIERCVLEWRCDPASPWRDPAITSSETRVILLCQEGYASLLAASTLRRIGLQRATDVAGGFAAWRAAGLPTEVYSG